MYQTRHTFASLMLSHGEDPLWVARMLGHTTLDMIFRHYGKFIRNRMRRDGTRFLKGFEEAGGVLPFPTPPAFLGVSTHRFRKWALVMSDKREGKFSFGHKLVTSAALCKKGVTDFAVTP